MTCTVTIITAAWYKYVQLPYLHYSHMVQIDFINKFTLILPLTIFCEHLLINNFES